MALKERDENPYSDSLLREFDFSCKLKLFASEEKVLIIPYYKKNSYYKFLSEHFSEYSYFNNTEKPEDISSKEWKERRDSWLESFDINKKGVLYNLVDTDRDASLEDILSYIETMYDNRINDLIYFKFGKEIDNKDINENDEILEYRKYLEANLKRTYTYDDIKSIKLD